MRVSLQPSCFRRSDLCFVLLLCAAVLPDVGRVCSANVTATTITAVPALAPVMGCVVDPVSPSILQNASLSYFDKAALWFAKSRMGLSAEGGCPQLPNAIGFVPGAYYPFYFDYSRVSHPPFDPYGPPNATASGIRCAMECTSNNSNNNNSNNGNVVVLDGIPQFTPNFASPLSSAVAACQVIIPSDTPLDTVCTAWISYNTSYNESGTVFAVPSSPEFLLTAAILDPSTMTVGVGRPSNLTIWLPPQLTSCPWYYNTGALGAYHHQETAASGGAGSDNDASNPAAASVQITITFVMDDDTLLQSALTVPLLGARCEVSPTSASSSSVYPSGSGGGVYYTGQADPMWMEYIDVRINSRPSNVVAFYVNATSFTAAYFLPMI